MESPHHHHNHDAVPALPPAFVPALLVREDDNEPPRSNNDKNDDERRLDLTNEHLSMLADRRWKAALAWTTFHPDEVSRCRDSRGLTALHFACLHKCPAYVVEAITYAARELASVPTESTGELAIHWAARLHANDEVLGALLKASPDCGLVPDAEGVTAVDILWDRHETTLQALLRESESESESDDADRRLATDPRGTGWRKIVLMLRSWCDAQRSSSNDDDDEPFSPLHAAIRSLCPLSLVRFLCRACPSALSRRDGATGRTPLSEAAATPPTKTKTELLRFLLESRPSTASVPDRDGRLPLTSAIRSGHDWDHGLRLLFDAEPRVLSTRDAKTHMYPFMLVRPPLPPPSNRRDDDYYDDDDGTQHVVDTTFQLLRADPSCVRIET